MKKKILLLTGPQTGQYTGRVSFLSVPGESLTSLPMLKKETFAGGGISQRTCTNDPWTWTAVWGLIVGEGRGLGRGGQGGNMGTAVTE